METNGEMIRAAFSALVVVLILSSPMWALLLLWLGMTVFNQ
jgi:uncharacterized protein (DUF983 family)